MTNETNEHRSTRTVNGAETAKVTQIRGIRIDTAPRPIADKPSMISLALTALLVSSEANLLLPAQRDGLEHG